MHRVPTFISAYAALSKTEQNKNEIRKQLVFLRRFKANGCYFILM